MNNIKSKVEYVLKHNRFLYKGFWIAGSIFFRFIGVFVYTKPNKVLFTAHGRRYNDSPRAIYEYMIKHTEYDQFDLIWGLEEPDKVDLPGRGKKVKMDTMKYFITALSCKYWITCVNIERGLRFKKNSIKYLNTWHGFPTKAISENDPRQFEDLSYIDFFCATGDFDKQYYHKYSMIPYDHFIMCGFPRMDTLYSCSSDEISSIKKRLKISTDKKIILYAPTWRDSSDKGSSFELRPPINLKKWQKILGDKYVLLLRLHPYTKEALGVEFNDFVKDYSSYDNVNDLLKITDILISDYSGIFFEYAVLERPMICFGYDIDHYKEERGLAIDLAQEIPNGVLRTEEEILNHILRMNYEEECKKTRALKTKYLKNGGHATIECINALFGGEK